MTLDEYRVKLIEKLRGCASTVDARSLLAEANFILANSRMSHITQNRFWESLDEELEALTESTKSLDDPKGAAAIEAVVAAARARIARYRAHPEGESPSTD